MKNEPHVSIIIPMYNRERYIREAINSVLSQTFQDFEIVVIDDGSDDSSVNIVESITDNRIHIYKNESNMGIPRARNIGLLHARGEYIAILDSDDVMRPARLEKQIAYLNNNREYVGVGSWSNSIDEQGSIKKYLRTRPVSHESIKASLLFHCSIHNRSFTARSEVLKKLQYDEAYDVAEDYELLIRILDYGKLYNLPSVLVSAREHDEKITRHKSDQNNEKKMYLSSIFLDKLGLTYTDDDLRYHIIIGRLNSQYKGYIEEEFFYWSELWLGRLLEANATVNYFNQKKFTLIVFKMWLNILLRFKGEGINYSRLFSSQVNKTIFHEILN